MGEMADLHADMSCLVEDHFYEQSNIESRAYGRDVARELLEIIEGDESLNERAVETLLQEMKRNLVPEKEKKKTEPLSRLEFEMLTFGKYANTAFRDIPLEYLDWLCGSQESMSKRLKAYLNHPDNHRTE